MQWSFNTANNQATNAGIQYDADGNLISVDNGATVVYVYDALNERVERPAAFASRENVYLQGSALAELNPSTGAWKDMICSNGGPRK
jgi:YD repeat-containing protein